MEPWWDQQLEVGDDPEECIAFAWVESDLYPELVDWYEERAEAWREAREAERAERDREDEEAEEELA